jgi:HK97 family phage major capsid protein
MSKLLDDLRTRRTELRTAADALITRAADEQRDLTPDEFRSHADTLGQLREVDDRVETLRDDEVRELRAAAARPAVGAAGDQAGEMLMRAISEASGIGAAATPPEYAASFWDRLVPQSVLLQSGVQVVQTSRDSLVIPRITADPSAAWTSEGATITASDPGADTLTATPRKLAALVRAGNESLADSSPSIGEMLNRQMARSLALSFDLGAFEGSGTAPAIRGLKNVVGIQATSTAGANGALLADLDLIADALGLLDAANAAGGAIVMHPRTWAKLSKIKELTGSVVPLLNGAVGGVVDGVRRSLLGVPVYLSAQLSITETQGTSNVASSIYVYDPTQVVVVRRQDVAIEVDSSVYFASDETAIRAIMRADVVVPNPLAVVRIAGVL